jgi:hypothetical protein
MMVWFLMLYYPIIGLLMFIGNNVATQYPNGSLVRDRTEMALGWGVLALPGAPSIIFIGSLIVHNPHEPIIQTFVAFCAALVFGAMHRVRRTFQMLVGCIRPNVRWD